MKVYRVTYIAYSFDGFDSWQDERGLYLRRETAEAVAARLKGGKVREVEVNED